MLLETKSDKGVYTGWSILRENLRKLVVEVAYHPSEKKVRFLKKAIRASNQNIAIAGLKAVVASGKIDLELVKEARKRKADAEEKGEPV